MEDLTVDVPTERNLFADYLDNNSCSDVNVLAETEVIKCHRVVLYCTCKKIKNQLVAGGDIKVDTPANAARIALKYVYGISAEIPDELYVDVLDFMHTVGACDQVFDRLFKKLPQNVDLLIAISNKYTDHRILLTLRNYLTSSECEDKILQELPIETFRKIYTTERVPDGFNVKDLILLFRYSGINDAYNICSLPYNVQYDVLSVDMLKILTGAEAARKYPMLNYMLKSLIAVKIKLQKLEK